MAAISTPKPSPALKAPARLNIDCLQEVCGSTPAEVAVYGFSKAGWKQVMHATHQICGGNSPVKKMFSWQVSDPKAHPYQRYSLEGRYISHLPPTAEATSNWTKDICKTTLTNIVVENTFRRARGVPIIPVIFALEGPTPGSDRFDPLCLTDWEKSSGVSPITRGELRRAWKMTSDPGVPQGVRDAALETFRFVRADTSRADRVSIEKMPAPWDDPRFAAAWRERYKPRDRSSAGPWHWRQGIHRALHHHSATELYFTTLGSRCLDRAIEIAKAGNLQESRELLALGSQCKNAMSTSAAQQEALARTAEFRLASATPPVLKPTPSSTASVAPENKSIDDASSAPGTNVITHENYSRKDILFD